MSKMDARFAARVVARLSLTVLGFAGILAGIGGEAFAQNYPGGPYAPAPPGGYRGAPIVPDDDDDLVPLPAPGPYGRPSGAPYPYDVPPPGGGIQREALPAPGFVAPPPRGGAYADAPPPSGRGYNYGPWDPLRPPRDASPPHNRAL